LSIGLQTWDLTFVDKSRLVLDLTHDKRPKTTISNHLKVYRQMVKSQRD